MGNCQWTGEINWHDGAEYALGVGEGVLNVAASVVMAPITAAQAIADPNVAIAGIQQQAATIARGADVLVNDPAQAAAIINANPRAVGEVMGEALGTAMLAAAGGGGCSFDADTPVLTANGLVPIGSLHVGDTVLAYNAQTQTTEPDPIAHVWVNHDPVVEYLTIAGERLETTPEHPFFVLLRGWVPAGDLHPGDQVRRADGRFGSVQQVIREQRTAVMYNLTIANAHTFFVGEAGWLVHNTCDSPSVIAGNTSIKPSAQGTVTRSRVANYAEAMRNGTWDWQRMDPIEMFEGSNGTFILDGHHRFLAAKMAGVEIPETAITVRRMPNVSWPKAAEWTDIRWDGR